MKNIWEKVEKKRVYLMAWACAGSCGSDGVERCQLWGKQNELSCLLLAPTPAEAVATQRISAQRVSALTESACSHHAHKT